MSSKVQFEIYHGDGTVEDGPNEIILRGFKRIRNSIDKLAERIFLVRLTMLERGFHINSKTTILTVHVVVNRATEGIQWELLSISNTND